MIDLKEAEKMLSEARTELEKRRGEFEALQSMIAGLEQWVELNRSQPVLPLNTTNAPLPGAPSMRSTVLQVLRDAGKPMHTKDVYDAAYKRGARTTSKDTAGVTELTLIGLMKRGVIERVAPRTYKFVGP